MKYSPEQVLERITEFAKEINLRRTIDGVIYRNDYLDYQVLMDDRFHAELREKLIDVLFTDPNHADTRREITYLLRHAFEFEEWEDVPAPSKEQDIIE
ncbi:MAG: hypothetical protein AB1650_01855 [Candidatus Omnitrophota bacterium]